METSALTSDALIVGGGFYGIAVALHLKQVHRLKRVVLCEQEDSLMMRASRINQARVHTGYHYPRSYVTAYRSRVNMPAFLKDWPEAIYQDFTKIYAIARHQSKISARHFETFCASIEAPLEKAPRSIGSLFNDKLIEQVFLAQEYSFDYSRMAQVAQDKLIRAGVEVVLGAKVAQVQRGEARKIAAVIEQNGSHENVATQKIFNCTYSALNQLGKGYPKTTRILKHELAEMACVRLPPNLSQLGITVMDGPFFSLMPYPSHGLHTLSHVRYTPRKSWEDKKGEDPKKELSVFHQSTVFERMVRDASRYVPSVAQAKYEMSLIEVKTVLARNEADDGRPILFEEHQELPGAYAILGGKIDNIYDILERLDASLQEEVT